MLLSLQPPSTPARSGLRPHADLCKNACHWQTPALPPPPDPAPQGGEVLAAGRARGPAAKIRNQPQALERIRVEGALKGSLRRASPALDRPLNAPLVTL